MPLLNDTPIWAGLTLDHPRIMGILNVTPDSFSGAGPRDAAAAGLAMAEAGADIIDVGGESTRPGSAAVPPDIEQNRVIPVVRALAGAGLCVSVDTRNAATMRAALDAGARIINDVSGLSHDPGAAPLVASRGCPVVLMHMRGTPDTMNAAAVYGDVVAEVRAELAARIDAALAAGIAPASIAIDPGIGFAKLAEHSRAILRDLQAFTGLGYPVLVGVSRKSFIGTISGETRADRRLGGSLSAAVFAALRGAKILRVHDVPETVQAFRVWHSLLD
jgi:dihydropteroate synthase